MKADTILAALEVTAQLIARLDARISATPLAEAWQVRACFLAAERLAAVDGTPTRSGDILGLMMDAPLPSPAAYRPATIGFGHWRRCMARIQFGELASRLLGRSVPPALAAEEAQLDWDIADTLPPAARRVFEQSREEESVDAYALAVSERALDQLRRFDAPGSVFKSIAEAMKLAIRVDPDPDYFERIYDFRRRFEADVAERMGPLPSPAGQNPAKELIASIKWEKTAHLGACFAVLPDRLQEMGLTANRLSCLTGATKRLGFEGRLDDRAFIGFLRQLTVDARAGLALLDSLESLLGRFGRSSATKFDPRSPLPDILYAFLVLPAVDVSWLEKMLGLKERVTFKLVKRLADGGLISHWGDRKVGIGEGHGSRSVRLWGAASFEKDFNRSIKRRGGWVKPGLGSATTPAEMLNRHRDIDVSIPMSIVYARFDNELIDLDQQFGRFFERKQPKNRASRKPV